MKQFFKWGLAVLALALAAGCGGGGDSAPQEPLGDGTVAGVVTSAVGTGEPIAGAVVSFGDAQVTSDGDGAFELPVSAGTRQVLHVTADGYAEQFVEVSVRGGQTLTTSAQLYPVGTSGNFLPASLVLLDVPDSTARVELPAGSVVRSDGTAPEGVNVALTSLPLAQAPFAMPGGYTTSDGGLLESWGALVVTLTDNDGARLNLADGQTATIRIPVSSRNEDRPATLPLHSFDEQTHTWREEGTATLVENGGNAFYEATVGHFSIYTIGYPTGVAFLAHYDGCVQDGNGVPVAAALIHAEGLNMTITTPRSESQANGRFILSLPPGARFTYWAQDRSGNGTSNTLTSLGSAVPGTTRLSECLVIGTAQNSGTRITITWAQQPFDLDAHLFMPDGTHVYYGDSGSADEHPYATLDVDDRDGFGPEVITLFRPMVGPYIFSVNNYLETLNPGMTQSLRVEVNVNGRVTPFTLPPNPGPNQGEVAAVQRTWWTPFTLTVNEACGVTIIPSPGHGWSTVAPEVVSPINPRYCSPPR